MLCLHKVDSNEISFEFVDVGDVFMWEGDIFIKIEPLFKKNLETYFDRNVICLSSDAPTISDYFDDDTKVILLDAELTYTEN